MNLKNKIKKKMWYLFKTAALCNDRLQTTYFYVRVRKNPAYYKMDPKNLKVIAVRSLSELAGASIVSFDEEQLTVRALLGSTVMSRRLMVSLQESESKDAPACMTLTDVISSHLQRVCLQ